MAIETAAPPVTRLVEAFTALAEGPMAELPLANPALRVEAVGFLPFEGGWAGVLITPWAINLLLLPGPAAPPLPLDGRARPRRFPSGIYEFHAGHLDSLGHYQSCSLFSPPAQFPDQAAARAVALEVMALLFLPAEALEPPPAAVSRRAFLRGRLSRSDSLA